MNDKIVSSFIWRFLERWGAQGVTFIVSIILARILEPEVYGTLALVTVFTTLLQVFIDSGLGTALIQKKDADDLDFSTVFWFNLVVCLVLYVGMYACAPMISRFYNYPDLTIVIRVLSITLIVSGVKGIQQSYVARNLLFKRFFFSTLGGTLGAAVLGIFMAYRGFGVWALVAQYLFNNIVDTIILWATVKWRPKWIFSFERFKQLFNYGWKILLSSLLDTFYNEIRSLIIGKFYTSKDLAFYDKGKQFPEVAVVNINSSMNSVLLPVLANRQDDLEAVKAATRRVIRMSSYIIWPMMVGLAVVAPNFVTIVLTDKWLPATFYVQILCFTNAFQPLQTTNLSVIKALGRSDLHLKMEVIKKLIAIAIVIISAFFGVKAVAIGALIYSLIATCINSYPNKKLINYSYSEQIRDIIPFIIMSLVMGVFVYLVGLLNVRTIVAFTLQIIVGVVVYLIISIITKIETFDYSLKMVRKLIKK